MKSNHNNDQQKSYRIPYERETEKHDSPHLLQIHGKSNNKNIFTTDFNRSRDGHNLVNYLERRFRKNIRFTIEYELFLDVFQSEREYSKAMRLLSSVFTKYKK